MFCLDFLEILEEVAAGFYLCTGRACGSKPQLFPMGKTHGQVFPRICSLTGVGWMLHKAAWLICVVSLVPNRTI